MKYAVLLALGLVACDGPQQTFTTTYFAEFAQVDLALNGSCGKRLGYSSYVDHAHSAQWSVRNYLCVQFDGAPISNVEIETRAGNEDSRTIYCGIRIGPARLTATLTSFEFMRAWFKDPQVASDVIEAIGHVDPRYGYRYEGLVDKLRVTVDMNPNIFGPATLMVDVNGCEVDVDRLSPWTHRVQYPFRLVF